MTDSTQAFAPELRFPINFLRDGNVVSQDGEYLGTWDTDESDAIWLFTPDGATEPLLRHPFLPFLCEEIQRWQETGEVEE